LHPENQINYLQRYMDTGFSQVQGWCSDTLASLIATIDTHQKSRGVHGGMAEIGVHHGKLFIDNSGSGSLAIFKDNLQAYDRHQGANVSIISADSVTANLSELIDQPVRLFSIDGGHTAEHTISDLKKAQLRLHPEGVIVLDDILNYHWLGVIEGTITFLRTQPTLVPVAIGLNKLFLVNLSFAEKYRELFRGHAMMTKYPVKFCGHDVVAL
jgi:hypothetical protein